MIEKDILEEQKNVLPRTSQVRDSYANFENILERKGTAVKKEIEARMNGQRVRKYGKDLARRTELLRKNIESKKKSELIKEMKSYSEQMLFKNKILKVVTIIRRYIFRGGLLTIKNYVLKSNKKCSTQPVQPLKLVVKYMVKVKNKETHAALLIQKAWRHYSFRAFLYKRNDNKRANENLVEIESSLGNNNCSIS